MMCTMIVRRVVVRSSGRGSSKRAWMQPPIVLEQQHKPAKPTVAEQFGMIASVVAVAVASVAATA